jgi:hypothetical protein
MDIRTDAEIVRNDDGTLTVQVEPERRDVEDEDVDVAPAAETVTLHPGEGGYDEALAQWDLQQDPDRGAAVSTASGRDEAMSVVHQVANDDEHEREDAVEEAVEDLDDPGASAEALRHVLVGGQPSVEGFAAEVADAEGGEPIPPHQMTKIIGEVLAEIDE